jgi:hypothetical protein
MTPRARLVALAITGICLLLVARQVRRRQMRATYLVVWTSLCVIAIPFIAIPGAIDQLSSWIGIYYPPATAFLLAIIALFLISIHFSRQLTRLEERTRILAEELALMSSGDTQSTQRERPPNAVEEPVASGFQPMAQTVADVAAPTPRD